MKNIFIFFVAYVVHVFSYEASLSKTLAEMSEIAYQPAGIINAWNCSRCKKYQVSTPKAFRIGSNELQGFVGYLTSRKAVVVAFRGSDNIKNWISNLDVKMDVFKQCEGCKVHGGFYDCFKRSKQQLHLLISGIFKAYQNQFSFLVTGHSLGGAIATFAALDLKASYNKDVKLYTFGQPRIGNIKFAQFLQRRIPQCYRVVYDNDLVVDLPSKLFEFYHGGKQIWYKQPDMRNYKQCKSESQLCSNSAPFFKRNFQQHGISNYVKISDKDRLLLHLISGSFSNLFHAVALNLRSDHTQSQQVIQNLQSHQKIQEKIDTLAKSNI